jgi:hypothetical protein
MMDDDQLLDFDRGRHATWDEEQEQRTRRLLVEQPDLYRNHLAIAKWIDRWRERMTRQAALSGEWAAGFDQGVGDIAAHLRQGDLVPGGDLLRQEFGD